MNCDNSLPRVVLAMIAQETNVQVTDAEEGALLVAVHKVVSEERVQGCGGDIGSVGFGRGDGALEDAVFEARRRIGF